MTGPDYQRRATQHRPHDPEQLSAEIRRLVGTGLKVRDISVALRIDLSAALEALQPVSPSPTSFVPGLESRPARFSGSDGDFYQT